MMEVSLTNTNRIVEVASDCFRMPSALKCARYYFYKGGLLLDQLLMHDENALNPLQMSLLSLKCFRMGFVRGSVKRGIKDHTSFIAKLLSHPVLKGSVNQNFPNGLSPLDLAQQFELSEVVALIEGAGGRPGVWADIPQDVFIPHRSHFLTISTSLSMVYDPNQGDHEAVKKAVIALLGGQTVLTADDGQLMKVDV